MTPTDFRAWHAERGYTYNTGAAALGMGRATYARYLAQVDGELPRWLMLACTALAAGLKEWRPAGHAGLPATGDSQS